MAKATRMTLKRNEVCVKMNLYESHTHDNYLIEFPRTFIRKVESTSYYIDDDKIVFTKNGHYGKKAFTTTNSICCKSFVEALMDKYGFPVKKCVLMGTFSCEFGYDTKVTIDSLWGIEQETETSYKPTLFIEPDEPEFESQEDVLERVKNDILSLRKMGVKCSFSYETTKVVTETI